MSQVQLDTATYVCLIYLSSYSLNKVHKKTWHGFNEIQWPNNILYLDNLYNNFLSVRKYGKTIQWMYKIYYFIYIEQILK
jgi:hypothetical protein